MSTDLQTIINQLLQMQPAGSLFFASWMYQNGISYELQAGIVSRNGLSLWLYYISKFDCAALRAMTDHEG